MRTALFVLCCCGIAAAQTLPVQNLEGDVFDALTGAPLAGVSVAIAGNGVTPAVRSDAAGHFRVVAQSGYSVSITKTGYLSDGKPLGQPLRALTQLRFELTPEAVISGRLEDEDGFPVERTNVQAMRYQTINGEQILAGAGYGQSNDLGEFRIAGLRAGQYYLRVDGTAAGNWDPRYVTQFLGGALRAEESKTIAVKAGEIHAGADIRLVKHEGVTVSGRVEGMAVDPRRGPLSVTLQSEPTGSGFYMPTGVRRGGETTFDIRHVPPGNYTLRYQDTVNGSLKAGDLLAEEKVKVADQDLTGLVLRAHTVEAIDLEGKVVMPEGASPAGWLISVRGMSGMGATAHPNEDGSFVVKALLPGHYNVQIAQTIRPDGIMQSMLHVMSATIGNQEVRQKGFDLGVTPPGPMIVTMSSKYANVSGVVVDPQGKPVVGAVVLFMAGAVNRGMATTDEHGVFHTMLEQAGDYQVSVAQDPAELKAQGDKLLTEHQGDFPVVHATYGENAPMTLVMKGK